VINVFVCVMPIIGTFMSGDMSAGFASLLAYCFTAMAVVFYFALHQALTSYLASENENIDLGKAEFMVVLGFFLTLSAIGYFFFYSFHNGFNTLINHWVFIAVPLTVALYLGLALWLAKPLIHRQAGELDEAEEIHQIMKRQRKTKKWAAKTTDKIRKEGI